MPPISCSKDFGLPEINYKERSIKIYLNNDLYPNNFTFFIITREARVINPSSPGEYSLKISTSAEPDLKGSLPYYIVRAEFTGPNGLPKVEVEPKEFGSRCLLQSKGAKNNN